jgi:hypothetical protein
VADIVGIFQKGEDIRIALEAVSGDRTIVGAVTAVMRKVRMAGSTVIADRGEPIAVHVITREPQGCDRGGWTLTVPADAARDLPAGFYGIDARLVVNGAPIITDQPAIIQLSEALLS